jgi:hypothetical protein
MKLRNASSSFEDQYGSHNGPTGDAGTAPPRRSRYLQLSPIAALAFAVAALVWGLGLETDRFGFHLRNRQTVSPEEAVDISLKRLVRAHVAERLKREHRLISSPQSNREVIDEELSRIRDHPLYTMIKKQMTDHLREVGYAEVLIKPTQDPNDPMVSMEAEFALTGFIHSLRASFPAPNDKIATFLKSQEKLSGKSLVDFQGADRCDLAFNGLIMLLYDYPDDLEPVAGSIKFIPRSEDEIERDRRGANGP